MVPWNKNKGHQTLRDSWKEENFRGTSLVVQWLRLHASTAGGVSSVPGWETKILHAAWHSQKKKKRGNSRKVGMVFLTLRTRLSPQQVN